MKTFTDMTDRQTENGPKWKGSQFTILCQAHIATKKKNSDNEKRTNTLTHKQSLYQIQYINLKCGRTCLFAVMELINFHKNCVIIIVVVWLLSLGEINDYRFRVWRANVKIAHFLLLFMSNECEKMLLKWYITPILIA